MKKPYTQILTIQTQYTAQQLLTKLSSITALEFHDAVNSPAYKYYGTVSGNEFDIRNKKYGPYSTGPGIKGTIGEMENNITVIIKTDTDEQMSIIKKMSYPYFIFLGLFIAATGAALQEIRLVTLAVGAFMIFFPFLQAAVIKRMLKSMQKDEVKQFSENLCHLSWNISNLSNR